MFEESAWNEDGPEGGAAGPGPAGALLPPRPQRQQPPVSRAAPPPCPGREEGPGPVRGLTLSRLAPSLQGPAGNSRERRRRLLATLRRLEGSSPWCGGSSSGGGGSSSASDSEAEEQLRKKPRQRDPAAATQQQQQQKKTPGRGEGAAGDGAPVSGSERRRAGSEGSTEKEPKQPLLTRKQWRNRQKNKRRQRNKFKGGAELAAAAPLAPEGPPGVQRDPALSAPEMKEAPDSRAAVLRLRMEGRLDSARFRYINQQLYTCSSQEAARLFQEDPEALAIYHRGFAQQVARWPESPVQRLVRYLRHRPATLVVADFGCGDCTLARSLRNKVHCFDLVALDPRVIVCDMAQVPLEAESVDVAVFCLALMGTNLREILEEASRVLKVGGTLLVAEVASRFSDVRAFVGAVAQLGFQLVSKDVSGSYFYTFEFSKALPARTQQQRRAPLPALALRPCLYKRR
ncbi:ribosomal RNA-processing protein 8 [Elgaria multicarinata webbii]|uniref:ribosomal RNA-processing protein 8 n=1 Tax=Elgaria multicarinata webbii TaxID=159646 RepID=UPI002FCD166D